MNHPHPATLQARRHRGLTMVELLVAVAISLVLVLAATRIYLATRESQRTIDQASSSHEAAGYALRTLGRELMNAGFYPAVRTETADQANVLVGYSNITGRAAYDHGIFGCEGAAFDPSAGTCGTAVAGAPDTVVVGYFTSDAFGTSVGQRADCAGNDVSAATVNSTRVGSGGASVPPAKPLFVANHFTLISSTATIDGRTVNLRSFACNGNGSGAATYQPLIGGIDDLQVTYAVYSDDSRSANRFYTATEVNALSNATIDGASVPPWARVIAVRICVIARTYESAAAVTTNTYTDCNGTQQTGDQSLRQTYVQVFGVRNRQTFTY